MYFLQKHPDLKVKNGQRFLGIDTPVSTHTPPNSTPTSSNRRKRNKVDHLNNNKSGGEYAANDQDSLRNEGGGKK